MGGDGKLTIHIGLNITFESSVTKSEFLAKTFELFMTISKRPWNHKQIVCNTSSIMSILKIITGLYLEYLILYTPKQFMCKTLNNDILYQQY